MSETKVIGVVLIGMACISAGFVVGWFQGMVSDVELVAVVWAPWVALAAIIGVAAWSAHVDRPPR